jgi:hypothetical protein
VQLLGYDPAGLLLVAVVEQVGWVVRFVDVSPFTKPA